jgi:hypothetical protein
MERVAWREVNGRVAEWPLLNGSHDHPLTRSPILNRLDIGDSVRSSERGERLAHRTHVAA